MARLRGAFLSPRHKLAGAMPHIAAPAPSQVLWLPAKLSMWNNDQYGCCVTAEEAFAKATHDPEIFISDAEVKAWAEKNGVLNGTDLITVLELMQNAGFVQDNNTYNDGGYRSVDWTNADTLKSAIAISPVKIAVAADQLENAIPEPPKNGWFATGFQKDTNTDHCVSLCGFGSFEWLWSRLRAETPDPSIDGTQPAYAMFTWSSVGIITVDSMLAITEEAWVRNPVTVIVPNEN
jgi:hypothetical protein